MLSCSSHLRHADPSPLDAGDVLGVLSTPTVTQDCVILFPFSLVSFRFDPPRCGCGTTPVFSFPVDTISPRPPFQVIWRWFSWTLYLSLACRPLFFPFLLGVLFQLRILAVQSVGVGFVGPHLRFHVLVGGISVSTNFSIFLHVRHMRVR